MKKNRNTLRFEKAKHSLQRLLPRMLLLIGLYTPLNVGAQCTSIVCNDSLLVSVNLSCEAVLSADAILEDPAACPGTKTMVITDPVSGAIVVSGPSPVTIPSAFLGAILHVEVIDDATGNSCSPTVITLLDNLSPVLNCPNDTIFCTASIDPANLTLVTATDNCDSNVDLVFTDSPASPTCSGNPFIDTLQRTWIATDDFGNKDTCVQSIFIVNPDTADVVFPADITLDCTTPSFDPSITGVPLIGGNPIDPNGICQMIVGVADDTSSNICPIARLQIIRTWTVVDNCTGNFKSDAQLIVIKDDTPPLLTCPSDITVGTDPGNCVATINLPLATATDDCGTVTITVNASYGQSGLGPHFNVALGSYTATYTAMDDCGNASTCTINVTVIDDEAPIAVCDQFTNVSLSTSGVADVPAIVFDDGSTDNCSPVTFEMSRDGVNFGPTASFDCSDVGVGFIPVFLKVMEAVNPSSATTCMVQVEVEDKLAPLMTCPDDLTIDCEEDVSNLAVFGDVTVSDNCSFTLVVDSTFNINVCGQGTILRTFTATDPTGNIGSCTQTISVENFTPFDGSSILWPADFTATNTCLLPDSFLPDSLPSSPQNFNAPIVNGAQCAMIATSYSDQIFKIDFPACYKIVRTWVVVDWCQFSANDPFGVGRFEDQQIIKVLDTEAPVITFCPPDVTVGLDSFCLTGFADLLPLLATDCNPNLTITNDSPFAFSNGADASGLYPEGVHTVRFTVDDGCGNESSCDMTITVVDIKPPTPFCINNIGAELQLMGGQVMTSVTAEMFDAGSFDNCSSDILLSLRKVGDTTTVGPPFNFGLTFGCSDLGPQMIELWATDQAGNSDFCTTTVIIQDNMIVCNSPDVGMISGAIQTEMGEDVENVRVEISGNYAFPDTTGLGGSFAFPSLPVGISYTVTPEKDMNPLNGVSTYDMVLLSRHVLNIELLDSPYKIIAADVNHSGTITTMDIVELRKVILQIQDHFQQNNSWRFADKNYVFPDPANPFVPPFPEAVNVPNLTAAQLEANFTGVKIGDLNLSAIPNSLLGSEERSAPTAGTLSFVLENKEVEEGRELQIPFRAKDFKNILGCQFTLRFDNSALAFEGFEQGDLMSMEAENLGLTRLEEGVITVSWFDLDKPSFDENKVLFSLRFKGIQNGELVDYLEINSRYTRAEAYDGNDQLLDLDLQFSNRQEGQPLPNFALFQNRPNPFRETTTIGFQLPEASPVTLTIFDLSGRAVYAKEQLFESGYHELSIDGGKLRTNGVLYFQLKTPTHTATKKMILMK